MTVQLKPPKPSRDAVHYPESDGKPMAESDLHREIMLHDDEARLRAEEELVQAEKENAHLREELARLRGQL